MTRTKKFFIGIATAGLLIGGAAQAAQITVQQGARGINLNRPASKSLQKDQTQATKPAATAFSSAAADAYKAKYAKGEVVVKYKRGVSLSRATASLMTGSLIVAKEYHGLSARNDRAFVLVKGALSTAELIQRLKADPNIESVSPNYIRTVSLMPNDPQMGELWGLNNTGQLVNGTSGTLDADIDAPEAWATATGSASTVVAVFDTGVDYTHIDLAANMWVNTGEIAGDGLDNDSNGYPDDVYGYDFAADLAGGNDSDPMDEMGHGTHVSGTIGAVGNDGTGIAGVNWDVSIMALKLARPDGGLYDSDILEAIDYVLTMKAAGVNIVAVNASYGGYGGTQTDPMNAAIQSLGDAGIVFVAAAGNETNDNDATPAFPASYDAANIIAVAATDQNDQLASFSNWGATTVDIAAPGVNILSSTPGMYLPQAGDIFFDDFEAGIGNWTTGGTNNTWATSQDQEGFLNPSFPVPSPVNFLSDSPGALYAPSTDSWVMLASDLDLSAYSGTPLYLGFGAAASIESAVWDHGLVEVSGDSGTTWTQLDDFGGAAHYWIYPFNYLIPDAVKTANFRLRFHLTSDTSVQYDGWLIDNVGIGTNFVSTYAYWDGTSMAAPHVTGAVALLASTYPGDTAAQRRNRILFGSQPLANLSGKVATGGRLNLFNALNAAPIGPVVSGITPSTGMLAGSSFTISGTDFGATQGRVLFTDGNGASVEATVSTWSATSITAVVPDNAGKYITVEDSNGHASLPVTGSSWEQAAPLGTLRNNMAAVAYNGKVYVFGGYTCGGGCETNSAEVYDTATDTWAPIANMPQAKSQMAYAELNGLIYLIGGYSAATMSVLNSVTTYDPVTDTYASAASLPQMSARSKAVALNGKLYVSGGSSLGGDLATLYVYDPASDSWAELAPMSTARDEHGMVAHDGKLYVFGGANVDAWPTVSYFASAEMYNPVTGTWSALADMPIALARMGYALGTDATGSFIGIAGGANTDWWTGGLPVFMTYDFATGTWDYLPGGLDGLNTAKFASPLAFEIGKGFYSIGGMTGGASLAEVEFLGGYVAPPPPPAGGGGGGGGAMGLLFMLFGLFALGGRAVRRRLT